MVSWFAALTHNGSTHSDGGENKRKGRWGEFAFSMVELLVVVAILAILASVAIPLFLNQRSKAYKNSASSDATSWATQVAQVVSQYDSLGQPQATEAVGVGGDISLDVSVEGSPKLVVTAPEGSTPSNLPAAPAGNVLNTTVSPGSVIEPFTAGTVADGYVGFGVLKAWCFIVNNNGQKVVMTQAGELPDASECPQPDSSIPDVVLPDVPFAPAITSLARLGTNANPVAGFKLSWAQYTPPGEDVRPVDVWTVKYKMTTESAESWAVAGQYPAGVTTIDVPGLRYGVTYNVEVAGSNSSGQGVWAAGTVDTGTFVPEAPQVSHIVRCNTVEFSWAPYVDSYPAPAGSTFNGGSPISDVVLQYREQGSGVWITASSGGSPTTQPKVISAGLDPSKTYEYQMRARNSAVSTYSPWSSGTFDFSNPQDVLPAPSANPTATWDSNQLSLWNANLNNKRDFIFTVPTPTSPCAYIPVSSYEVRAYADNVAYAGLWKNPSDPSYSSATQTWTVPAGASTFNFKGTGDRYFSFEFRAIPQSAQLQPTDWSGKSRQVLTVPNPPTTTGITTWEAINSNDNIFRARFNTPSYYRTSSEVRILVDSYVPQTNTDLLGLSDGGRVKAVNNGPSASTSESVRTSQDPTMLTENSSRGNAVTNWTTYGTALSTMNCGSGVLCQSMTLNGTTNYYYSAIARNTTGESWASSDIFNPSGPSKVGLRSRPEKPQKPKKASFPAIAGEASTGTYPNGKTYTIWGFENSDRSQRLFLTGWNTGTGTANVVGNSTDKNYRRSLAGQPTSTWITDASYTNVYPVYNTGMAVVSGGNLYPCSDEVRNRDGALIVSRPNAASVGCSDSVTTNVAGYTTGSNVPGWAYKTNFYSDVVYGNFEVQACNIGMTYNSSTKTYSINNFATPQCAESETTERIFTAPEPRGLTVNPFNGQPCPRCLEIYSRSSDQPWKVRLWDTRVPQSNLPTWRPFSFQYSGLDFPWLNAAHKASANEAFDSPTSTTCNYSNTADRKSCSYLSGIPGQTSGTTLLGENPLVLTRMDTTFKIPRADAGWFWAPDDPRYTVPDNRGMGANIDYGAFGIWPGVAYLSRGTSDNSTNYTIAPGQADFVKYRLMNWDTTYNNSTGTNTSSYEIACTAGVALYGELNRCGIAGPQYSSLITATYANESRWTITTGAYLNAFIGVLPTYATINPWPNNANYGLESGNVIIGQAPNNFDINKGWNKQTGSQSDPQIRNVWWYERSRTIGDEPFAANIGQGNVQNETAYPSIATSGGLYYCTQGFGINGTTTTAWSGADYSSCGGGPNDFPVNFGGSVVIPATADPRPGGS